MEILESLPDDLRHDLGNARLEAVCLIDVDVDVDGEKLLRGVGNPP